MIATPEWLATLEVGDLVACTSSGWSNTKRVIEITKLTPTQIHCGGEKFRKRDGARIGASSSYYRTRLMPFTDEIRAEFRKRKLVQLIEGVKWDSLSVEVLEQVAEVAL